MEVTAQPSSAKRDFIRYAEFNVPYEALETAMQADIDSYGSEHHINWIEPLAYLGAKYGGNFSSYKKKDLASILEKLKNGENMDDLAKDMKYYPYYYQVYSAVLGGFLGEYQVTVQDPEAPSKTVTETKYGLQVYSPIAKTFPFQHYDDFGASRSYGYQRNHLGHDLMAATGTPVIAVESGTVEVMGWNQYGGWRIGIRSFDKKRYYYYAHLRQNRPYQVDLTEGKVVNAGDVIGYVGRTGYSTTENVNNINTSHLHFGLELIFDESQKECDNEIWIDLYAITNFCKSIRARLFGCRKPRSFIPYPLGSSLQQGNRLPKFRVFSLRLLLAPAKCQTESTPEKALRRPASGGLLISFLEMQYQRHFRWNMLFPARHTGQVQSAGKSSKGISGSL